MIHARKHQQQTTDCYQRLGSEEDCVRSFVFIVQEPGEVKTCTLHAPCLLAREGGRAIFVGPFCRILR